MHPTALAHGLRNGPVAVPTAAAFALVRDLLAERPRHFRELLLAGVGLEPTPATVNPASARMKGKGKAVLEDTVVPVPEEHPFRSASYLKKHILPVLASQGLVAKDWRVAAPGSALERVSHPHTDRIHAMWVLQTEGDAQRRWDALTSGTVTRRLLSEAGLEVALEAKAAKKAAREAAFARGEAERTDKEVMAWEGRPKGFTVRAERLHLNRRRQRRRDFKEEHAASRAAERDAAANMAKELLAELRGPA
ncbi:hypothetical protein Q8F55_002442 [Vanrija albida]|uniref:Uncharacterized protein n=1 Tax=Vanrija albida TaxID=181172 RepID=A0ABR3QAN9_9TREE